MRQVEHNILLRIFMEESYRHDGRPAYQALVNYLRKHKYAGATVLRGIEGFGRSHHIHTAEMLELSTDLPIVIEIIETPERAEQLKDELEQTGMVGNALITEEKVTAYRFTV